MRTDNGDDPSSSRYVRRLAGNNCDASLGLMKITEYIGEKGGAEVIVQSMWVHADDMSVQEKECRGL